MDSDVLHLKQAITEKLRRNGTLDRMQAELRCAVFLAIEENEDNELEEEREERKLDQRFGYSMIYHFLRQNRCLATAAVFEKEIHQKIISLEELKKEDAAKMCFQFSGDSIKLSNLTLTGTEENMNETHSTRMRSNKIHSNFVSSFEEEAIQRKKSKNGMEAQNDRSFQKVNGNDDDKVEEEKKGSDSSLESSTTSEEQPQQQRSATVSRDQQQSTRDQQQSTKSIRSLSSTYPRKLPPIKPISNESSAGAQATRLPSISLLNDSADRTGTVPLSRLLDTILNSPPSHKNDTDEDITEEIISNDPLQSDSNSDATISF